MNEDSLFTLKKEDYIKFFLSNDSIRNFDKEIYFTFDNRYKCNLNCGICYIDNWLDDDSFKRITSKHSGLHDIKNIETMKSVLKDFELVISFDDLFRIKNSSTSQYEWYKKYSYLFSLPTFTDNGLYTTNAIDLSEFDFTMIAEMAFSEKFIYKHRQYIEESISRFLSGEENPKTKAKVKYPIYGIKIIQENDSSLEIKEEVKDFVKFLEKNKLRVLYLKDINKGWDEDADSSCPVFSENKQVYIVRNHNFYMAGTDFYIDFHDYIEKKTRFKVGNFSNIKTGLVDLLPSLLQTKIDKYKFDANRITNKKSRMYQYYTAISESIKINKDFTYIPITILNENAKWIKTAVDSGEWVDTGIGLYKKDAEKVISIIEVV